MRRKGNPYLNHRIRLGQTLQALHQLGQLRRVLGLHGDTHHGTDAELHHAQVVGVLERGQGAGLHQELVNTHQTNDVTARHVLDGLDVTTHHQDGPGGERG